MVSTPILVAIALALAAPVVTYLTVVRRLSGKIGTTDASKLWEAAESMREEYRDEIKRLQAVVDRMEKRLDDVEGANAELREKNGDLHRMIEAHEQTIADLRKQVAKLAERNEAVETENVELRRRIGEVEANGA